MSARVKICGLTSLDDVAAVNAALPDYAGFVFADSRRKIDADLAAALKKALRPEIRAVGVFVNNSVDCILRLCERGVIDCIQLHGDETDDFVDFLKRRTAAPVICAVRVGSGNEARQKTVRRLRSAADFLLFDTFDVTAYGGTGRRLDLTRLPAADKPFFLAGGLRADNVREAVAAGAYGVDVSGGVETDGKKDAEKIMRFAAAARGEQVCENR